MESYKKIKDALVGHKFYLLMAFGIIVAGVQYFTGVDLGVPALPVTDNLGELAQQVYLFFVGSAGRAAVAKI